MTTSTHTVGAFAVILDDASRVLLCHRTDVDMWNLPGGQVDADESPWSAVQREVEEEVGLRVRVVRLLGVYAVPNRADLVFSFLCARIGGELCESSEADRVGWFDCGQLPPNTLPRHAERIADAVSNGNGLTMKEQVWEGRASVR